MRQKIRYAIILFSFLLFPITLDFFSPYLSMDGVNKGIISGSLLLFLLLFISSLISGRAFCAWVCPGGGIQEAFFLANKSFVRKGNFIKYIIWLPWIGFIIFFLIKNDIKKIQPLYMMDYGISVSSPQMFIIYYSVVGLIFLPALIIGRRSFCHHICWMAPFMIIGRKIRNIFKWYSLKLKATPEACSSCNKCIENCPMSLEVSKMVRNNSIENSECILCGMCADNCAKKAVRLTWNIR